MSFIFVCRKCAAWKPEEQVTFKDERDALKHAILVHPSIAIRVLLRLRDMPALDVIDECFASRDDV